MTALGEVQVHPDALVDGVSGTATRAEARERQVVMVTLGERD